MIFVSFFAPAADLYVSPVGCDQNPGTADQPFRTISFAHSVAGPGGHVIVLPGVYTDYTSHYGIRLSASGTATNPIVVQSQVPGGAVIDGLNTSDRNVGIYLQGNYTIIDGFEIRNNPNGGISIWGSGNEILDCEIHHNGNPSSSSSDGRDGVYSDPSTEGNVYWANYIHHNGRAGSNLDHGLYLCGKNEAVLNNVLVANAGGGLQAAGYSTVRNLLVYNNIMAWNGTSGILLWQELDGVDIKNNILYQNGHFGLGSWDAHGTNVVMDHNLSYANAYGDYDLTSGGSDYSYVQGETISADPLLVDPNPATFDAHVNLGSPTADAGLNLWSVFGTDKEGTPRPVAGSWDLGPLDYPHVPAIRLTGPASNTIVSGSGVALSAVISGISGKAVAQFQLDGVDMGLRLVSPPYNLQWDSTAVPNGIHVLTAVATDLVLGGGVTAEPVSLMVSNWTAPLPPPGLTFASTSGVISGPFYLTNDAIVQPLFTFLESSGRAVYSFTVPTAGQYVVGAVVDAPSIDENSFYVNIDAEPSDPYTIWDIPLTAGPEIHTVSWRGNGTQDANQFVPAVFSLTAGAHELIVCGREADCTLGTIGIMPAARLTATLACGSLQLTWPTNAIGYRLESFSGVAGEASWSAVTNTGSIEGDHYKVLVPPSGVGRVFKLSGSFSQ